MWLQLHFTNVCSDPDAMLITVDGEADHVHLLVEYPPKLAISELINRLKGTSGRLLRIERRNIAKRYYKGVL